MSSGLRERKKDGTAKTDLSVAKEDYEEEDKKKEQAAQDLGPVDLEPDFFVVLALVVAFALAITAFVFYRIDNRTDGAYATFINRNIVDPMKRFATPKNRYQKVL